MGPVVVKKGFYGGMINKYHADSNNLGMPIGIWVATSTKETSLNNWGDATWTYRHRLLLRGPRPQASTTQSSGYGSDATIKNHQ